MAELLDVVTNFTEEDMKYMFSLAVSYAKLGNGKVIIQVVALLTVDILKLVSQHGVLEQS